MSWSRCATDASAVDTDFDTAKSIHYFGDDCLHRCFVCDIDFINLDSDKGKLGPNLMAGRF